MGRDRTLWRVNRLAMMIVFALALSVKLLVPQGFMLGEAMGTRYLTVQLCDGDARHQTVRLAIPGKGGTDPGQGRPDQHCPYAALAMGALGAAATAIPERAPLVQILPAMPERAAWRGRAANLPPPSRGPPATI